MVRRNRAVQSYLTGVIRDTLGRWGARFGLAWLIGITFLAVFAPLLANSRPFLIKMDNQWSSPMLRHFTPADVTLLVTALAAVTLLLLRRIPIWIRWVTLAVVVVVTLVFSLIYVNPPKTEIYSIYREAAALGRVQFVLNAPIPYSPSDYLRDQTNSDPSPSLQHWLGCEELGSDVASRLIHASRIALAIGFIAEGIAVVIGVIIGALMGYFAGVVDIIGMRLVEIFSAIPTLYLLLAFVAYFGRNIYIIMVIIGMTSWTGYTVFTRAEFLRLRKQDFVQAAQALGLPLRSILFRHMFPNGMSPVLVSLSFGVASAILAEATLSFLGLGVVGAPSWGQLLNQATKGGGGFRWWLAVYPGLVIFLTVFGYNLIGESVRDAVDPHLKKASML
ncbi:MAG: ABC transporter permease [Phycisphaeraceae bacterium]|nr:ABC transporter permease [Phycisphaeraceae bacterium]